MLDLSGLKLKHTVILKIGVTFIQQGLSTDNLRSTQTNDNTDAISVPLVCVDPCRGRVLIWGSVPHEGLSEL